MKTKFNSPIRAACHSFGVAACAGAFLLVASGVPAQNLFEVDQGSDRIYEFTPEGVKSTFASGLAYPNGLAFNNAGDLFVSNLGKLGPGPNGNITKITPDGTQSIFAAGLAYPNGLAFDGAGNLFVANPGSNNIVEISPDGVQSTFASGLSDNPIGLAFDSAGNLYVSCYSGNIYKFNSNGAQTTFASGLAVPEGLAFNDAGDLFVANFNNLAGITRIKPGGAKSTFASGLRDTGLAFNSAGVMFVANSSGLGNNIIKITPGGVESTFASGLNGPEGLAFQPARPVMRTIAQTNGRQVVIGVGGVLGQTIVLQSSPNLQNWLPLATNALIPSSWNCTNNAPQNCSVQFYRALWLQ